MSRPPSSYDVVVVGGGHNGLVAAAYVARAGLSCLVLERRETVGGAAVSERVFPGFDVRVSRYAYLVSLLPRRIVEELALPVRLIRRAVCSYTPDAWQRFHTMVGTVARSVFPTLLEPLRSRAELSRLVADDTAWEALVETPLAVTVRAAARATGTCRSEGSGP